MDDDRFIPRRELDERFRRIEDGFHRIEQNFDEVKQKRAEDIALLTKQHEDSMKLLVNGAQAALNTSWQLNGDEKYGVEGFIPEIRRKNAEFMVQGADRDKKIAELTENQQSIKKTLEYIAKFFRVVNKIVDWRVYALAALATIVHWFPLPWLIQISAWVHKFLLHKN